MRATLEAKVVTATRLGRGAALPYRIRRIANQRKAAFVTQRTQLCFVGLRRDDGAAIDPPVTGMQHRAERRADDETVRFRYRMRHGDELDVERAKSKTRTKRNDVDWNVGRTRLPCPLGGEECGRERGCMDRDLELRPEIEERAKMVLVRMREHEAQEIAPLLYQIADVRKNDFDTGQLIPGESDPHVDHNPAAVLLRPEAIKGEIHSDLAYSAERREHELIGGPRHARAPISRRLHLRSRHPRKAYRRP
jgi:hypothetical protein